VFTGWKDRTVVLLGLIVSSTSVLAALLMVIVARLLVMVLGTSLLIAGGIHDECNARTAAETDAAPGSVRAG
jgi:hypothetical protein